MTSLSAKTPTAPIAAPLESSAAAPASPHAFAPARTEEILKRFHEESSVTRALDSELLARIWVFIRPHRRLLWLTIVGILLTSTGALVRPLLIKHLIDDGASKRNMAVLMRGGAIYAAITVAEQAIGFVKIYVMQLLGARSMAALREHVFRFLHSLSVGFFDHQPVGRLVTRVTSDVDTLLEVFASGALDVLGDMVKLIGVVIMMLSLDYRLALIGFAATPFVATLIVWMRPKSREAFREIRLKTARMNSEMNEQVAGMSVIQAFGREARQAAEFDGINAANRDANMRAIKYESIQDAAVDMVVAVSLASIVVSLGYRSSSFGTLVAFTFYLALFWEPISALAQRYLLLQSAMSGAERVFALLDVTAPDAPLAPSAPPGDRSLAVSFEDVEFAYKPDVPVLRHVNLSVKRGERVAFVGPTGSGKSTLVALALRLYDVQSGAVRVLGDDVKGLERDELRRRFSVVPQDVFLFPGTIAENVAAGDPLDEERVRSVLARIGALEILARRPGGLGARIEEHAANFSSGERQLIAFARALYRDAPILMLDEATASIDSDTEQRLSRAFEELTRGRTSLVVAHRLSTIRSADRIIVVQHGRIVEQGTHEELIAARGLYEKLYELQLVREAQPPSIDPASLGLPASLPSTSHATTRT